MLSAYSVIACLWLAFLVTWLVSALFTKRSRRHTLWKGWVVRLVVIAVIVAANLRFGPGGRALAELPPAWQWAGAAICALGLGFAVWARIHLGRNWGMPMSLREGHELVTTGPYAYVRHPIYTGILLAMLGSALTVALAWLWALALFFVYFLYSAFAEERMMSEQFPEAYAAYKARSRMLIPFIF
ncbi:MAG: methyltransferase family protein [Steroidobacteraceae bacterium]